MDDGLEKSPKTPSEGQGQPSQPSAPNSSLSTQFLGFPHLGPSHQRRFGLSSLHTWEGRAVEWGDEEKNPFVLLEEKRGHRGNP